MGTLHYEVPTYYNGSNGVMPRSIPKLRPFDLKVGEKIAHRVKGSSYNDNHEPINVVVTEFWTVTGIYPYVFTVINRLGIKSSFMKKEYQLGEVWRVD